MTLPSVAAFSPMRLSCMVLRNFHQETAKGVSGYESRFDWRDNFETFRYIHWCFLCRILQRRITKLSLVVVNNLIINSYLAFRFLLFSMETLLHLGIHTLFIPKADYIQLTEKLKKKSERNTNLLSPFFVRGRI